MQTNKILYFLHIPKTGGTSINIKLKKGFELANILTFPTSGPPHTYNLEEYRYITGHFAKYPLELIKNLEVACLFRDPVDRAISTFLYIYNKNLCMSKEYLKIEDFVDKVRHYLFFDPVYYKHNNIQAQFICNSPNIFEFYNKNGEKVWSKKKNNSWGMVDPIINFKEAKKQIDNMTIVGITDNQELFLKQISEWFFYNYKIFIDVEINNTVLNKSFVVYNGKEYTTKIIKNLLTNDEIKNIVKLNNVDNKIYQYVCKKIAPPIIE